MIGLFSRVRIASTDDPEDVLQLVGTLGTVVSTMYLGEKGIQYYGVKPDGEDYVVDMIEENLVQVSMVEEGEEEG